LYHARSAQALINIGELEQYLTSDKFNSSEPFAEYVNRDDVLRWLDQVVKPTLQGRADIWLSTYEDTARLTGRRDEALDYQLEQTRTEL